MIAVDLRAVGYEPRRDEELAVVAMLSRRDTSSTKAVLLEGPPGCGKTALAQAVARALRAEHVYALLHAWSDADELFVGVDVAAAVAGDSAAVRQDGVLATAARLSLSGQVVLCLDELDKAQERAEALLLGFLQDGRVPVAPGVQLQARLENLLVFITSNGQRDLTDALLRRVCRVRMQPLPRTTIARLVTRATGAPASVVATALKAALEVRGDLSVQELSQLVTDLRVAASCADVRLLLAQWGARTPDEDRAARASTLAPAVWAELLRSREDRRAA